MADSSFGGGGLDSNAVETIVDAGVGARVMARSFRKHFGAVAGGTVDCAAALQAILTGGKSDIYVNIEPGIYRVDSLINVSGGTKNIVISAIPGTVTLVFPNSAALRFLTCSNILVSGIKFDVQFADVTNANAAVIYGFSGSKWSGIVFEKCEITAPNSYINGFLFASNDSNSLSQDITIRDCYIHHVGKMGIECINHGSPTTAWTTRQSDLVIERNKIQSTGILTPTVTMTVASSNTTFQAGATQIFFTGTFTGAKDVGTCEVNGNTFVMWRKTDGVAGTGFVCVLGDQTAIFAPGATVTFAVGTGDGFGISISGSGKRYFLSRNILDNCFSTGIEIIGSEAAHMVENHFRMQCSTVEAVYTNTLSPSSNQTRRYGKDAISVCIPSTKTIGVLSNKDLTTPVQRYQNGQVVRLGDTLTTINSVPVVTPVTLVGRQFYLTSFTVANMPADTCAIRACDALQATNVNVIRDLKVESNVCEVMLNGAGLSLYNVRGAVFSGNTWASFIGLPATGAFGTVTWRNEQDNRWIGDTFRQGGYQCMIRGEGASYPEGTRHNKFIGCTIDQSEVVNAAITNLDQGTKDTLFENSHFIFDSTAAATQFQIFSTTRSTATVALTATNGAPTDTITVSGSTATNFIRAGQMPVGSGADLPAYGVYITSQLTGTTGGDGTYQISQMYATSFSASMNIVDQAEIPRMFNCTYEANGLPGSLNETGIRKRFTDTFDSGFLPVCDRVKIAAGTASPWGGLKYHMPVLSRDIVIGAITDVPHNQNAAASMVHPWDLTIGIESDATGGWTIVLDPLGWGVPGAVAGSATFTGALAAATTGTLSAPIANGVYGFRFSNGVVKKVTVTGGTTATWAGAVTATASVTYLAALSAATASGKTLLKATRVGSKMLVQNQLAWM